MAKNESNQSSDSAPARWACISDKGRVREENEDAYLVDEGHNLFIVSDGMGGHAQGAKASQIVIDSLPSIVIGELGKLKSDSTRSVRRAIRASIVELNRHVRDEGTKGNGHKNMGATVVMALLREDRMYVANVGDSRAYLFRNKRLRQLTMDHTLVAELVEAGHIEPDEARNHPRQHVITQCVGIDSEIKPFVRGIALKKDDRLLLCSDGLTMVVPNGRIRTILKGQSDVEAACKQLVSAANAAGGLDNITVLAVDID
jgi:serine/threonine protein phosphatase PrpC